MTDQENLRAAYQGVLQIYSDERDNVWSMSNALRLANSIVLIALTTGLGVPSLRSEQFFAVGLPIAGIILCACWLGLVQRGYEYQDFYVAMAREMEGSFLGDHRTLSTGARLAGCSKVVADRQGFRMRLLAWIPNRWFVWATIGVFLAAYAYLLSQRYWLISIAIYALLLLADCIWRRRIRGAA